MSPSELRDLTSRLETNCHLGRKLVVVIGAGASRGIGAPGMGDIHGFLKKSLESKAIPTTSPCCCNCSTATSM